ncbi:hypothetical protein PAXRUDRAFT_385088 [Paxillus rubicundulus Ve08.2h10]|uniref:Uncharacterized protein n=1 Tax=Paxillus rubicundulus Ve08.2h10 TaxID=930991 RepID=A0A0D0E945_9AGAM|nr:hypothetical protein PAXRUDRAFT_385088 [Paxillus rubicundulus Ve08.2h10]
MPVCLAALWPPYSKEPRDNTENPRPKHASLAYLLNVQPSSFRHCPWDCQLAHLRVIMAPTCAESISQASIRTDQLDLHVDHTLSS